MRTATRIPRTGTPKFRPEHAAAEDLFEPLGGGAFLAFARLIACAATLATLLLTAVEAWCGSGALLFRLVLLSVAFVASALSVAGRHQSVAPQGSGTPVPRLGPRD